MPRCRVFDQARRQAEKAASRLEDADDLRSGRVSPVELGRRNAFFANFDKANAKIVAIGVAELSISRA